MSTDKTGGPAFPVVIDALETLEGMSLRDYFASKTLQGFSSRSDSDSDDISYEDIAQFSYSMADAMIVERAK